MPVDFPKYVNVSMSPYIHIQRGIYVNVRGTWHGRKDYFDHDHDAITTCFLFKNTYEMKNEM